MIQLLTGGSGFLGQIIIEESYPLTTITVSRSGADINLDLSKVIPNLPNVDLVIHAAGKAHSRPKTSIEKQEFFDVNFIGTRNLLEGLENSMKLPKAFVFISTVAVYGCEHGVMINENSPLNATEPYGLSKIQAEQIIEDWCAKNNVVCTILRLPLLVGQNPPGNLGAMITAIKKGYYFNIAGGRARKSMVFAADVARIIPIVSKVGGIYNLTDGCHPSFKELSLCISQKLGKGNPLNIPKSFAMFMASIGDLLGSNAIINTVKVDKIVSDLTFDDSKARNKLKWKPSSVLANMKL